MPVWERWGLRTEARRSQRRKVAESKIFLGNELTIGKIRAGIVVKFPGLFPPIF